MQRKAFTNFFEICALIINELEVWITNFCACKRLFRMKYPLFRPKILPVSAKIHIFAVIYTAKFADR